MTPSPPNVTAMLRDWSNGDRHAQDQLFRAVYNELHRQAARYLRHENPGLSLQTTDLIHEAYLRLIDQPRVVAALFVCRWKKRWRCCRGKTWTLWRLMKH